jgi:hypothetical protein
LTATVLSLLAALGTGIGVLGFLVFVGAATWLARYRGAGISGTYGVSVLPRTELIVAGADQLLGPTVAALVAVAVTIACLLVARRLKLQTSAWLSVVGAFVVAGAIFAFVWYFPHEAGDPFGHVVRTPFAGAVAAYALGATLIVAIAHRVHPRGRDRTLLPVLGLAAAVVGTILVYAAFETYARNLAHPEVRPAAVVEASGVELAGFYVGEDADTLFIAVATPRLAHAGGPRSQTRVVHVPKAPPVRFAVGSTFPPERAKLIAADLLVTLRAEATTAHG